MRPGYHDIGINTKRKVLAYLCANALDMTRFNLPTSTSKFESAGKRLSKFAGKTKTQVEAAKRLTASGYRAATTPEAKLEAERKLTASVIYVDRTAIDLFDDAAQAAQGTATPLGLSCAAAATVPASATEVVLASLPPSGQQAGPAPATGSALQADGRAVADFFIFAALRSFLPALRPLLPMDRAPPPACSSRPRLLPSQVSSNLPRPSTRRPCARARGGGL